MSVDLERENFHVNVVRVRDLEDFLSAQTYRPEITTAYQVVLNKSHKLLDDLCSEKISQGSTPIYAENGPLCLKSKDVDELLTGSNINTYVDINWALSNSKNKISFETLLLTRQGVGTIGRCAIYFGDSAYTNDSIFKIVVTKADSAYVATFLNTDIGKRLIEKGVYGSTGQLNLSVSHVKKLPIFLPNSVVQKYIGDKVRQAELLREWAKNIQNRATNILPVFKNRIADYKENYFKSNEIFSERLDSQFYHPNNIALEHELKLNNCVKLSHFAKLIKQNWDKDKAQEFLYFEIGGLDISTGLIQPELINVNDAPSRAKTKVRYADVLVSTVRPNRKNVGFIAIDDSTLEMVATSGFSVLRFEKAEIAAFYHFWLKSDDATSQLMRWNSGSAYPAIDDDVPLNILVPKFEQHLIDEWGTKLLFAQLSYIYAQKLVGYAKFIVEALIEDVITEEELIQAQNALEQGDKSLDRAILSQMTEDGYAVAGSKPLFADLDEFYDLLEQAKALE